MSKSLSELSKQYPNIDINIIKSIQESFPLADIGFMLESLSNEFQRNQDSLDKNPLGNENIGYVVSTALQTKDDKSLKNDLISLSNNNQQHNAQVANIKGKLLQGYKRENNIDVNKIAEDDLLLAGVVLKSINKIAEKEATKKDSSIDPNPEQHSQINAANLAAKAKSGDKDAIKKFVATKENIEQSLKTARSRAEAIEAIESASKKSGIKPKDNIKQNLKQHVYLFSDDVTSQIEKEEKGVKKDTDPVIRDFMQDQSEKNWQALQKHVQGKDISNQPQSQSSTESYYSPKQDNEDLVKNVKKVDEFIDGLLKRTGVKTLSLQEALASGSLKVKGGKDNSLFFDKLGNPKSFKQMTQEIPSTKCEQFSAIQLNKILGIDLNNNNFFR